MKNLTFSLPALAVCVALLPGCLGETPGPNRRPVARAGADRFAALSEPVVLDAGSSFDPDGDILSYNWDLVAAPQGGTADIVKSDKQTAGLAPDAVPLNASFDQPGQGLGQRPVDGRGQSDLGASAHHRAVQVGHL